MIKRKVTLEEFKEYYQDFLRNYLNEYRFLDLDFKSICFMKHGISGEEFDILIQEHERSKKIH
jgi:hypothetical protein|tara:strand:+ start:1179 stop:1367 length:189 start_codon:yes stop_codon:yes gene_type:complete